MAKDDYHVIAYQVLSYLYQRLKKGLPAETVMLSANGGLIKANARYWAYIIWNMQKEGYIEGVIFADGIDNL